MIAIRIVVLCSLLFIVAGCGSSDDRIAAPSRSNETPYSVAMRSVTQLAITLPVTNQQKTFQAGWFTLCLKTGWR